MSYPTALATASKSHENGRNNNDNGNDEDDATSDNKEMEDPSLSSASLCITFQSMSDSFRPVFTHQPFPSEHIRGYHPPLKILMWAQEQQKQKQSDENQSLVHSSHRHHEMATKELSITVHLAPSGEACQVNLQTDKKRLPRRQSQRTSKRPRLAAATNSSNAKESNEDDEEEEEECVSDPSESEEDFGEEEEEEENNSDSEFEDDEEGANSSGNEDQRDKEGATRRRRMPTKEIVSALQQGLPQVQESPVNDMYLRRPMGVELKQYSVKGKEFCISLANGQEVVQYHNQVQRLALWYIETADHVDVSNLEGGFWKVLYLYQKHKPNQFSLAGYITLFHFHAPFKKPKPGYIVRVCQALILPPYQRSGHGKQLLSCVFDLAHGKYQEKLQEKRNGSHNNGDAANDAIVEINVESPAPAFVLLRNRVDYECFRRSVEAKEPWIPALVDVTEGDVTKADYFTSIPESEVVQVAAKAKITPRQVRIVQELHMFEQLQKYLETKKDDHILSAEEERYELEKRFRLMVKKRLNKELSEDLGGLRTKAEKQAFLEDAFQKCLKSYRVTIPTKSKSAAATTSS